MEAGKRNDKRKLFTNQLLHSAAVLFLEKGYNDTTTAEIAKKAELTENFLFRIFHDKEKILYTLVQHVFNEQFIIAAKLTEGMNDPIFMYSIETALQFHITNQSEPLRDIYVSAYSLPSTTEYIYENTAQKLCQLFKSNFPDYEMKDFLEMEYATGGIMRSFMTQKCDWYFTIERKINRFLEASLRVYKVPEEKIKEIQGKVHGVGLDKIAAQLIDGIVERARSGTL